MANNVCKQMLDIITDLYNTISSLLEFQLASFHPLTDKGDSKFS